MKPTLYPNGFPSVYDELKTFYPVFYRDVFEMDAIWRAAGGKLDEIEAGVDAAANDTFISMMDAAALSDMEAFLDIAPNKNRTLEVRRKLVASYFVGANHIGAPEIKELVRGYTGDTPEVKFSKGRISMSSSSMLPYTQCSEISRALLRAEGSETASILRSVDVTAILELGVVAEESCLVGLHFHS